MPPVKLLDNAVADIRELPVAARRLVLDAIGTLGTKPDRGHALRYQPVTERDADVRVLNADRYRIAYELLPPSSAPSEVLVLAVLDRKAMYDELFSARGGTRVSTEDVQPIDIFISYAAGDAADVARRLAEGLRRRDVTVWFDEYELRPGDSKAQKIIDGLARSKHAAVILSPQFFQDRWAPRELDALLERESNGERLIVPVLHELTSDDVARNAPALGDRVALSLGDRSVESLTQQLADIVTKKR